jgi:hypothetical protein
MINSNILMSLLIIIIIYIFISNKKKFELYDNYSSLDIYYPNRDINKEKKDSCGNCGVICKNGIGNIEPETCYNPINNYIMGYFNPNPKKINIKNVSSPYSYNCLDGNIKEILESNYIYIYSKAFNKTLSFENYGNKSFIFIDPTMPYKNDLKEYICPLKNSEKECEKIPQKWRLKIVSVENPNQCLVNICSYDCEGLEYYLTGKKNGKVTVSLFGNGNDQVWKIIKKNNGYLIKSHLYCTYLSATIQGYMKKNAGNVSLVNITDMNYIGEENYWNIITCGKIIIPKNNLLISTYQPSESILDFPYSDSINPILTKPKKLKLPKDYMKHYQGRSVWMSEFNNVWNGLYIYTINLSQNFLCNMKNNNYVIRKINQSFPLSGIIKLNEIKNNKLNNEGKIIITYLEEPKIIENKITGQLFDENGKNNKKIYESFNYSLKNLEFNVSSKGSNILFGKNNENNYSIYLEMRTDKKIEVNIRNNAGFIFFIIYYF